MLVAALLHVMRHEMAKGIGRESWGNGKYSHTRLDDVLPREQMYKSYPVCDYLGTISNPAFSLTCFATTALRCFMVRGKRE